MEFSPELTSRAARIEREILDLNRHAASGQLESVARLLMRTEAISYSRIEGISPNSDKVVLAEHAQLEEDRGIKEGAEEVAVWVDFESLGKRVRDHLGVFFHGDLEVLYGLTSLQ